jgi:hypothetical protein
LQKPDISALEHVAVEVLEDQPRFRNAARQQAELRLGLDKMVDEYLKILL